MGQSIARALRPLALAALVVLTSCVMPDDMAQMQKDMADVQQRLQAITREQQEGRTQIEEALRQLEARAAEGDTVTRDDLADILLRVDQASRQASTTSESVQELNTRLDRYSQEIEQLRALVRSGAASSSASAPLPLPAPAPAGSNPPASIDGSSTETPHEPANPSAATAAVPDPETLYNTAYTDYNKGNYSLAVAGFLEYQELFPDSALADNALYWVGESHFSEGDYEKSVDAFDDLLERYPKTDRAAAANLKKALAFLERNQVGTAIVQLKFVVSGFPGTDEARLAADKLAGLGQ